MSAPERGPGGLRIVASVVAGVATVVLLAALSRVPHTVHDDPGARLRLSWRMQGETVEACRTPSPEELAELPEHMRNPQACQRRGRPYRLRVRIDGRVRVDRVVEPSGARGDRPVYVLEELPMPPGTRSVAVGFHPVPSSGEDPASTSGPGDGLEYAGTVDAAPGEVVLVTLETDESGREYLGLRTGLP